MANLKSKSKYLHESNFNYFCRIGRYLYNSYGSIFIPLFLIGITSLTYLYINNVLKYQNNQNIIIDKILSIQATPTTNNPFLFSKTDRYKQVINTSVKPLSFSYQPFTRKSTNQFVIEQPTVNESITSLDPITPEPSIYYNINNDLNFSAINFTQLENAYKAALK